MHVLSFLYVYHILIITHILCLVRFLRFDFWFCTRRLIINVKNNSLNNSWQVLKEIVPFRLTMNLLAKLIYILFLDITFMLKMCNYYLSAYYKKYLVTAGGYSSFRIIYNYSLCILSWKKINRWIFILLVHTCMHFYRKYLVYYRFFKYLVLRIYCTKIIWMSKMHIVITQVLNKFT